MKTKNFVLALMLAACSLTAPAQSSDAVLRDKITQAVMNVYDEQLAKEPGDYNTRFARAHQQYYNGEYSAAMEDVNMAMASTPDSDNELRFDEYVLRARIYDAMGNYASEITDLQAALAISPKSLACTDLLAKANLKMGNTQDAEQHFKTILRSEPMNYDAMYGLAQVELARGNQQAAIDHVSEASKLFPAEPQVYSNRADILNRTGQPEAAAYELVQGMCVGDGGDCMERLFDLSDTNYDVVMNTLSSVSGQAPNSAGMWRYIRANVAMDHKHYGQALKELNRITRNNLYDNHSVYYNTAKCLLELGRFDEAASMADKAIQMDHAQPEYYLVKSLAELNRGAGGNYDAAMDVLNQCSAVAPQYAPMLLAKARLLLAQHKSNDALGYLNAAVANEPDYAEALLTRGYLLKRELNNITAANRDFEAVTKLDDGLCDFKGFALYELGRETDAQLWVRRVTATALPGGENCYYAAALMGMRGDTTQGMELLKKALDLGYGSLYELKHNELPYVNIQELRSSSDFYPVLSKYQTNFQERD